MKTARRTGAMFVAIALSLLGESTVLADGPGPIDLRLGARAGCLGARGCFVGPELGVGVRPSNNVKVVLPVAFLHAPEASRWILLDARPAVLLSWSLFGPVQGYGRVGPAMVLFTGGPRPVGGSLPMLLGGHLGAGLDVEIAQFSNQRRLFLFGEVDGALHFGVRTPSTPLVTGGYGAHLGAHLEF